MDIDLKKPGCVGLRVLGFRLEHGTLCIRHKRGYFQGEKIDGEKMESFVLGMALQHCQTLFKIQT